MATDPEQQLSQAEQVVTRLQDTIREHLAAFAEIPSDADRTGALDDLLNAAEELQDAERAAETARQRVERGELEVLRTKAAAHARKVAAAPTVVAVVLGVLITSSVLSPWWWLLAVPQLVVGVAVMGKPIALHRPAIDERGIVAGMSVIAAVLSALAAIPWPWPAVTVVLIILAGLATVVTGISLGVEGTLNSATSKAGVR
ncbi:hypothetical protein MUY14_09225 [Amycolatopsis sp. FBCC-B4732]|uniref:hypothetical protein n=1 Tax=Amycolatopsis sp. FBCC-B4732 TaxID=3079339 RepID=UPI001FF42F79|nr:hypothetical protein [Amycolatopsis sp. FBCC-B4732]UOX90786.1 hypothetical protein MUY14_09225 [Amycolatopsis sp. FBCC-B4732]